DAGSLEGRAWRGGLGAGARDADLEQDRAAAGLRRHSVAGLEGGFGGGRCRSGDASHLAAYAPGTQGTPPGLRMAGLRPADQLDDSASPRVLVAGWTDQPAQLASALLLPPSARA